MICHAKISPDQKAAIETLPGRRTAVFRKPVSVRIFRACRCLASAETEIANELRKYLAEVDAARKPVSEEEADDIVTVAKRSARPGYRPRQ
jgi:hypothetical protein